MVEALLEIQARLNDLSSNGQSTLRSHKTKTKSVGGNVSRTAVRNIPAPDAHRTSEQENKGVRGFLPIDAFIDLGLTVLDRKDHLRIFSFPITHRSA